MAEIKCISLWQPHASLVAFGEKPFETRSWADPDTEDVPWGDA